MKYFLTILSFILAVHLSGQMITPESIGFKHLQTIFKKGNIDILIKSKKGEELTPKPLFLFIQGSLPRPLIIIYDSTHTYPIFPFKLDSLLSNYHVAIISKPSIPVQVEEKQLTKDLYYLDPKTKEFPEDYIKQNYLDYYVQRNLAVINYLQKQPWVSKGSLVVSGHSEGSSIAAKMASISKKITHLIYVSGNPMGRIMSIIEQLRKEESDTNPLAENEFKYWEKVVGNPDNLNAKGDTYKATYQFSIPPISYLTKVSIPVLVMYGTKDYSSTFNDFLHVEIIKSRKKNFTFKEYIGLEHNFFPLDKNGLPNYDIYNWDKVGIDMYQWLLRNK